MIQGGLALRGVGEWREICKERDREGDEGRRLLALGVRVDVEIVVSGNSEGEDTKLVHVPEGQQKGEGNKILGTAFVIERDFVLGGGGLSE